METIMEAIVIIYGIFVFLVMYLLIGVGIYFVSTNIKLSNDSSLLNICAFLWPLALLMVIGHYFIKLIKASIDCFKFVDRENIWK